MRKLSPLFLVLFLLVSACQPPAGQEPSSLAEATEAPMVDPAITPTAIVYQEFQTNICCHGNIVEPNFYQLPAWLNIPLGVFIEQESWKHYNEEAGELFGLVKGNSNSLGIPSETIYIFPAFEPLRASQFFQAFLTAKEFVQVAAPSDTTIAGYPARQVDLIAKPSTLEENAEEDTPYGVQPLVPALTFSPTGLYWTTWSPEAHVRVLKVDIDDYSVIIYLEAPQVDFERFVAEALIILETLSPVTTASTGEALPPEQSVDLGYVSAVAVLSGDELALNTPSGMDVDSQGNVYVVDTLNHRLLVFDGNGNAVASWGTKGAEEGQFNFQFKEDLSFDEKDEVIADVFIDAQDTIYVADVGNLRIQKFDLAGNFLDQFATAARDGQPSQAYSLAVDSQGFVYTIDMQFFVSKYDREGHLAARWGGQGREPGQFAETGFIAVDSADNIYAADPFQQLIYKFDAQGDLLMAFSVPRLEGSSARFATPFGVDIDAAGSLYITDYLSNRVVVLDPEGNLVADWSGRGVSLGQMYGPSGIALDGSGNVYVSEVYNHRVQKFTLNP